MPARDEELAMWWTQAPDGQLVVDEGGYVLAANDTLADWLDTPASNLRDTLASELFTSSARLIYLGLVGFRLAHQGSADEAHLELRLPHGRTLAVLCSAKRIAHGGGWMVLISMMPIARKHRLERELLEARQVNARQLDEKSRLIAELESLRATLEGRSQELELLNQRLDRQATTDHLTGLPNRRYFEEQLTSLLSQLANQDAASAFTLALLDIDYFKSVNDTHGHGAGDRVLVTLAELIRQTLRGGDVAARIGGEEFVLMMLNTPIDAARVGVERLRLTVECHAWQKTPITLSIGLAAYRSGDTAESLLQRADRALYRAKARGRNRLEHM
ncbi:sensor domain-containing diguanylate cyclase [Halomonas urumqiensis]|uniref:diguanylate cyclase n=1 Tax=Halomonas urumqiensis TaxID=1684789 RepID=A0A2N7UN90_9GAMM|nr:GGDEF domain-containing protein [Halomonas urumqiensis]PMR81904.1 hypothetical protein C1H70_03560 [Halomonas urumqiensis]PTB03991.1 hypothetical protein C6V82_05930 [Halomonas urumqiensis]GHE19748.1 hypothetical protein GCM10017767_02690 [Halomonas urumqiensis]